ncbi:MAG: pore-forming ESAT-6 family protein [Erysipelotrichaceae bacterium]|nr:pore-forming ESAT-6 family protein [Erysipelotrichaceae bacterium]
MDQNSIRITLHEVSNIASEIRNCNGNMDATLSTVTRLMNELNSVWQSEGQETLLARFQRFSSVFNDESEIIESYARFLDDTVSSYDSLESTIVANAANFD